MYRSNESILYEIWGFFIDENLSFKEPIHDKINKTYRMLDLIKQNFKYVTIENFTLLYKNNGQI